MDASWVFRLRQQVAHLGLDAVGISEAVFLEQEARYLEHWLNRNRHGRMAYMANWFDLRTDPRRLLPGARSVLSVCLNYTPAYRQPESPRVGKIARYAFGTDYHYVLKARLQALVSWIEQTVAQPFEYKICVDSAPVLDKTWAVRSGIGWMGKHTNVLSRRRGSWFVLGEIILTLALPTDTPAEDFCGRCRRCVDACPTQALTPYEIDASRCISYLTIELKDQIPSEFADKLEGWAFGCDICQEVCPWNRHAVPHQNPELAPRTDILEKELADWLTLGTNEYRRLTKSSPLARVKLEKLRHSLACALNPSE